MMTPKERAAMQQALDALEVHQPDPEQQMVTEAIIALREALDHIRDATKKVVEQAEHDHFAASGKPIAEQEHDGHWSDCSVHNEPAYQNGPCDCGGYPPKQKPVGYIAQHVFDWMSEDRRSDGAYSSINLYRTPCGSSDVPLYAAPVRTKDLTDDEIVYVLEYYDDEWDETTFAIARAVVEKFKEKNK